MPLTRLYLQIRPAQYEKELQCVITLFNTGIMMTCATCVGDFRRAVSDTVWKMG